jgi:SPP1 gp7 family putative phage head morphogenesis protein
VDYGHEESDKLLKKLEKRLNSEYRQASKEVKQKLDDYWAKFEIKDRAKRAERDAGKVTPYVRKYANMNGITDITQKTIDDAYNYWRKGQIMVGARWNEMSDTIAQDFHNVNNIAGAMIRDHSHDVYALNHNYGTFEIEKGSLIDTSYTLYDRATVERLVKDNPDMLPPPGKKVSQRIREGKDILWNKQLIQSSMTQSILQGESIPKIAKRLAESVGDSNRKAAIRNARTMTTGAENAGRIDSYKRAQKMGIKMKQVWLATLDGRTRDSHRDLDGEKIEVGEKFSNGCRFPGDPQGRAEEVYNCRCTLIAEVDGVDMNVSDTTERNNYKLGSMSYDEWKKGKDK